MRVKLKWLAPVLSIGTRRWLSNPTRYARRPDGYEAVETGTFWLSETLDSSSVGWDATLPRIASWVDLVRETGERLWICNLHFDHAGERARRESARLLRERADRRRADDRSVVVTGDCNCTSDSSPYETVTDGGLADARVVAGAVRGPEGTFHGLTDELRDRIDYVFVSPDVSVRRYRALEPRAERFRSDHVPLTADLVVDDPDAE
ncbi:endonuclease/exonuclease/phosphatase family protein [Halomontanus rarus]|uniref:endonuclease/exonuclease/phosphatase family protein n=1 Tax=Halomontanus rarus TaxID=3034020 RepID=UPI0023E7BE68|nr:endonuclease/exonuclease/phosphatase family protein [Halovivax sp. TS33]